jgi:putative PIN family toxin of toxin-antitoxin system
LRVVLDTNVVVSALLFGGRAGRLRQAWQSGAIAPIACRATVLELIRVLTYPKFRLEDDARGAFLEEYVPWCETVHRPDPPPATPPCDDPDDVVFLQLAIVSAADSLISGGAALLALRGRIAVPILTVAELFARMPAAGR